MKYYFLVKIIKTIKLSSLDALIYFDHKIVAIVLKIGLWLNIENDIAQYDKLFR